MNRSILQGQSQQEDQGNTMELEFVTYSKHVSSITSSSERYINNQFENIRSMELAGSTRSSDVTSAHIKDAFL
jgi:hypothetical protein